LEGVCAEGAGGGFEFGVEAGEGCPYDADDDGGVVEGVGEEDGGERMKGKFRRQKAEGRRLNVWGERGKRKERIGGLENCV
jgi:hypothetical protein